MDNRKKLLIAGFLTLIAAGMGFAIRGGILGEWAKEFGFTMTELGTITGGGLIGFGIVIMVAGSIIKFVGYKNLIIIAFVLHLISAVMTLCAGPVFVAMGRDGVYQLLFWSMFLFSVGNGICEAVINPLTATLYPNEKTHYLNILHAGWPGGLIIGGLVALLAGSVKWEILMGLFLVPVAAYGLLSFKEKFPDTRSNEDGISWGAMLKNCLVPLLFVLLIVHAMVGYVELGTDSWINKITGNILGSKMGGTLLFIYASGLMFVLRFFAGPIVHKISSLGLLLVSACLGAIGLTLISYSSGLVMMILAVTIYGVGKTFLWPTMLGVVGEQFPRSATVAMAMLGGIGMLSAGYLGGPGIGYKQDYFASSKLSELSSDTYDRYKAPAPKGFLFFPAISGIDGSKAAVAGDNGAALAGDVKLLEASGRKLEDFAELKGAVDWWNTNKATIETDGPPLASAGLHGSRMAIRLTALVPVTMAVFYLLMILGFKAKGGYKPKDA